MKTAIKPIIASALWIALLPSSASAAVLSFDLADHPDGGLAPPTYGLRLDGLFTGTGGSYWTWSFTDITMDVDTTNDTVHIYGDLLGGNEIRELDNSTDVRIDYDWSVNFVYSDNVTTDEFGAWSVSSNGASNSNNFGYVTLNSDADIDGDSLSDQGKSIGFVEFMGAGFAADSARCDGLPDCGPWVGEGWLSHTTGFIDPATDPSTWSVSHFSTQDWLFSSNAPAPVPVPAAAWLFGSALVGLAGLKRKK